MVYVDKTYLCGLNININGNSDSRQVRVHGVDYRGKRFEGVFDREYISNGRLEVIIFAGVYDQGYSLVRPAKGQFINDRPDGMIPIKNDFLQKERVSSADGSGSSN